jgi:hypothetical protein
MKKSDYNADCFRHHAEHLANENVSWIGPVVQVACRDEWESGVVEKDDGETCQEFMIGKLFTTLLITNKICLLFLLPGG